MSLRIRRGTEAQRLSATFDLGEIAYATDTNKLYVGDGVNVGGKNILATSAGTGLIWNATTQRLDFNGSGSGIVNVQADASPALGGNLNLNNRNITGVGITINGSTGSITTTGIASSTITSSIITTLELATTQQNFEIKHTNSGISTTIIRNLPVAANHTKVKSVTVGDYGTGMTVSVSRNSVASPQATQPGDALHSEIIESHDGTNYRYSSGIFHIVDPFGTVSTGSVPGAIGLVAWTANNIADFNKSIWLNSVGRVSINKGPAEAIQATLDINGFAKLAVLTVAPTAPANGMIAIADGTTWNPAGTGKSVMVVYLGGGWRVSATAP